jgi:hypothetical protein
MSDQKSRTAAQPPAPGTAVTVHLLVGGGRMPVVSADLGQIVDQPVTYLRLQVDDQERHHTRHVLDVSISGPPADVASLVAQLAAAVDAAQPPEGGEQP